MRNQELLEARNKKIQERYNQEHDKGFRHQVILEKLSQEFWLEEFTIGLIVSGYDEKMRNKLKEKKKNAACGNPNQINLLDQIEQIESSEKK